MFNAFPRVALFVPLRVRETEVTLFPDDGQ